ncbi:hypothetical protein N9Z12_00110 [Opitutaceae bacterium]|nr:hypothetical protein [Opitutaceae bacterium]
MPHQAATASALPWARMRLLDLAVFLGLTLLAPWVVHMIPSWDDSPIGAKLLPIFYAPLIAALTGRGQVAITVALLAPWVNHLLFGMPPRPIAILLNIELVVFSIVAASMASRWSGQAWLGPVAYLATKPIVFVVLLFFPALMPSLSAGAFTATSTIQAWPGLIVLAILSMSVSKLFPPHASA